MLENRNTNLNKVYVFYTLFFALYMSLTGNILALSHIPDFIFQCTLWFLTVFGLFLVCIDLFTTRYVFKTKYCYLLIVFILISLISAFIHIGYGYMDNIKLIVWTLLEFCVFYPLYLRFDSKSFFNLLKKVFCVFAFVWTVSVIISIIQYLCGISYMASYMYSDVFYSYCQGFWGHRLFGIFNDPNYASIVSLLIIFFAVVFSLKSSIAWEKLIYIFLILLQYIFIILAGSRGVIVAGCSGLFFGMFLLCLNILKRKGIAGLKRYCVCLFVPCVCCLLFLGSTVISKALLGNFSGIITIVSDVDNKNESDEELPESTVNVVENGVINADTGLERNDTKSDISNNRFNIWKDYLQIGFDNFFIGLSPANTNQFVMEHYPELYIVTHIAENNPEKFEQGVIYEPHNAYLKLFVNVGIVGFLVFIVFLVLCAKDALLYAFMRDKLNPFFIVLLMSIAAILAFSFFFTELFFLINNTSLLFWLFLSAIMGEVVRD